MIKGVTVGERVAKKKFWMLIGIYAKFDGRIDCSAHRVCCIFSKSNIADQVSVGQGSKSTVGDAGEGPLVVPSVGFAFINKPLPNGTPIIALDRIPKYRFHQSRVT